VGERFVHTCAVVAYQSEPWRTVSLETE